METVRLGNQHCHPRVKGPGVSHNFLNVYSLCRSHALTQFFPDASNLKAISSLCLLSKALLSSPEILLCENLKFDVK